MPVGRSGTPLAALSSLTCAGKPTSSALPSTRQSARRVFEFSRSINGGWQGRRGRRARITQPDAVWGRENHVSPCQLMLKPVLKRRRIHGYPKHPPAEGFFRRAARQRPGRTENYFVFFPDYHCRVGGGDCCQLHSESADRQDRRPWKHGRPFRPDHCPNAAAHRAGGFSHVLGAGLSVHDAPHCPGAVRFPQRDAPGL